MERCGDVVVEMKKKNLKVNNKKCQSVGKFVGALTAEKQWRNFVEPMDSEVQSREI